LICFQVVSQSVQCTCTVNNHVHNTEKQISFQVNWVNTQAFFQLGTGLFNWVSHILIPVALLEIGYSLKQMTFGKQ